VQVVSYLARRYGGVVVGAHGLLLGLLLTLLLSPIISADWPVLLAVALVLLLPCVGLGLLVWRLWQRRWGQAVALALLIGVDVVVRYGYYFAFFVSSMSANPT
jgi:hypothetical protein